MDADRALNLVVQADLAVGLILAAGKLNSLSPLAVLGRGYAIAFDGHGKVIKRAADVASGDRLRVRVNEGDIDCIKE